MFLLKQFRPHEMQLSDYFKASSSNPAVKRTGLRPSVYLVRYEFSAYI